MTPYDYKRGRVAKHAEALIAAVREGHRRVFGADPERASPARISMWEDVNAFNAAPIPVVDLHPQVPNGGPNINDVFQTILAFQANQYPYGCPDDPCWDTVAAPCP
ncbi:MAG: hypothetical protein IIC51_09285 [Planctomycetes bacterium]|nr:hypothetical protein [Planctomycetota bacterium]